jgi:hypothetical protein
VRDAKLEFDSAEARGKREASEQVHEREAREEREEREEERDQRAGRCDMLADM